MRWALWTVAGVLAVVILLGVGLVALARHDVVDEIHAGEASRQISLLPSAMEFSSGHGLSLWFRINADLHPRFHIWNLRPWRQIGHAFY